MFNLLPAVAAGVIKKLAGQVTLGMFTALHTFGRDLKRNVHIHLSVTLAGLTNNKRWSKNIYFHHLIVKKMWRYALIDLLRNQYKAGFLKLPRKLKHIQNYSSFNSWLNFLYIKKWIVFLQKPSKDHKRNIEYLGKYLKRPPIGETRIKKYDGHYVTFEYLDHYDNAKKYITLPVMECIAKVIIHIHDCNFRCIRYFGFLANRVRKKLPALVHSLLQSTIDLSLFSGATCLLLPSVTIHCYALIVTIHYNLAISSFKKRSIYLPYIKKLLADDLCLLQNKSA